MMQELIATGIAMMFPTAPAPAPTQQAIDLTSILAPGPAGLCSLPDTGSRLFVALSRTEAASRRAMLADTLDVSIAARNRRADGDATEHFRTAVPLHPASWNGIRIAFMRTWRYHKPESHGANAWRLGLDISVERLRETLAGMSLDVPVAPAMRHIDLDPSPDTASISIERRGRYSTLVCEFGH